MKMGIFAIWAIWISIWWLGMVSIVNVSHMLSPSEARRIVTMVVNMELWYG